MHLKIYHPEINSIPEIKRQNVILFAFLVAKLRSYIQWLLMFCYFSYIGARSFQTLPQLQVLNISGNFEWYNRSKLSPDAFLGLNKLLTLAVQVTKKCPES